jgi:hypothetical protein
MILVWRREGEPEPLPNRPRGPGKFDYWEFQYGTFVYCSQSSPGSGFFFGSVFRCLMRLSWVSTWEEVVVLVMRAKAVPRPVHQNSADSETRTVPVAGTGGNSGKNNIYA